MAATAGEVAHADLFDAPSRKCATAGANSGRSTKKYGPVNTNIYQIMPNASMVANTQATFILFRVGSMTPNYTRVSPTQKGNPVEDIIRQVFGEAGEMKTD